MPTISLGFREHAGNLPLDKYRSELALFARAMVNSNWDKTTATAFIEASYKPLLSDQCKWEFRFEKKYWDIEVTVHCTFDNPTTLAQETVTRTSGSVHLQPVDDPEIKLAADLMSGIQYAIESCLYAVGRKLFYRDLEVWKERSDSMWHLAGVRV